MKLADRIQKEKRQLTRFKRGTPEYERQWTRVQRLLLKQAHGGK